MLDGLTAKDAWAFYLVYQGARIGIGQIVRILVTPKKRMYPVPPFGPWP